MLIKVKRGRKNSFVMKVVGKRFLPHHIIPAIIASMMEMTMMKMITVEMTTMEMTMMGMMWRMKAQGSCVDGSSGRSSKGKNHE